MNQSTDKMLISQLLQRIEERPQLDFGNVFSASFELFKKIWGEGVATILLTFLCTLPLYGLLLLPLLVAALVDPMAIENDDPPFWLFFVMVPIYVIVVLGAMTIGVALQTAFMRICYNKDFDSASKADYFRYLKGPFLLKSMVLGLYTFAIALLGMLACGIGMFYVMVPLSTLTTFYAFNDGLSAGDMVKAAFKFGNKNWIVLFLLLFVGGLVAQLGFLACGIGVLFTAMFAQVPMYFAYKNGVGFEVS